MRFVVALFLLMLAATGARAATTLAAAAPVDEVRIAELLFRSGDSAAALAKLDRAIAAKPRDAQLRFQKGVFLAELKRDADAIATFQALSEEFPELPEPYNNLAVLHAAQGRIDTARELLEAALRHDPGYRAAQENLGDVYVRLALRAYERAEDPANAANQTALARKLLLARQLGGLPR